MSNIANLAGNASRAGFVPDEPALIQCGKCKHVMHKGEPRCPTCGVLPSRPEFRTLEESDAWHEQKGRDTIALYRWRTWDRRQSMKVVPPSHPRYAAWMAFRCYLLSLESRRSDADLVAHIAAVIVMDVRRDDEGFWWFHDLLLDEDLADDLYAPAHDDKDHGMAGALLSLSALLADPVGSRDDILPGDHEIIVGAFQ